MDLSGAVWRKSSFSGENGNGDGCVEVAFLPGGRRGLGGPGEQGGERGPGDASGAVALRDTKDRSRRPHVYPARAWACFLSGVRAGEFDRG